MNLSPGCSSRIYLRLAPGNIALLKFLLEANDNLAYLSTVSSLAAVARLVFAPEQETEVRHFLESVCQEVPWTEAWHVQGKGRTENTFCFVSKREE